MTEVIKTTNINLTKLWEAVEDRRAWCALVHGVTKSQTRLNDSTTTTKVTTEEKDWGATKEG